MSLEDSVQQRNEKLDKHYFVRRRLKNLVTFGDDHYYKF
jgi:hypothetical protein